jgi:hypothetical protein
MLKACLTLILFSLPLSQAFESTTVFMDTPIFYRRYIEVLTLFNTGPEICFPNFYTLVIDLRIRLPNLPILMGATTFRLIDAERAHDEGIRWARLTYAHLRITIPEGSESIQLMYLIPTLRRQSPIPGAQAPAASLSKRFSWSNPGTPEEKENCLDDRNPKRRRYDGPDGKTEDPM